MPLSKKHPHAAGGGAGVKLPTSFRRARDSENIARPRLEDNKNDGADQFSAWLANNEIGDLYREILAPIPASQAIYGSPVAEQVGLVDSLLGDADYAVLQGARIRYWLFSEHAFLMAMEAVDD